VFGKGQRENSFSGENDFTQIRGKYFSVSKEGNLNFWFLNISLLGTL